MSDDPANFPQEKIILAYAVEKPANRFARMPEIIVVLLAIFLPGLSSSLIRGSVWWCVSLMGTVIGAFVVFGPLWGEVLFHATSWQELGLYPFLAACAAVEIISVAQAIRDRARAMENPNVQG